MKEKIKYYLKFLQDYNSSVVVIHTDWSPLDPWYTEPEMEKKKQLIESELEGVNLTHFFVDLVLPSEQDFLRQPYIEHVKALRCNTLNSILSHINSCPTIPSKKVLIPKTDALKTHDAKLIGALDGFMASTKSTLDILDSELRDLVPKIEFAQTEISKTESLSKNLKERLDEIDVDTEVEVGSKAAQVGWGFTWRSLKVEVHAPCEITNTRPVRDTEHTSWSNIRINGKVAEGCCESPWFRGCYGRLIALAPSRSFHEREITDKKQAKNALDKLVQTKRQELGLLFEKRTGSEVALADFKGRIDRLTKVLHHVSQERVSLQDYVELLKIYQKSQIGEIVKQYCEFLEIQNFWG